MKHPLIFGALTGGRTDGAARQGNPLRARRAVAATQGEIYISITLGGIGRLIRSDLTLMELDGLLSVAGDPRQTLRTTSEEHTLYPVWLPPRTVGDRRAHRPLRLIPPPFRPSPNNLRWNVNVFKDPEVAGRRGVSCSELRQPPIVDEFQKQ